jgi:hypothetical protein
LSIKLEHKRFGTKWKQALPHINLLLISSWMECSCADVVPKYLNSYTHSKEPLPSFILWLHPAFWIV